MILSGKHIREYNIITPHEPRTRFGGVSYGEGPAGYDIRTAQKIKLDAGSTTLAVSLEHFTMPNNILGLVKDKSTWARQGIFVQNTVIEPGWRGFLTLEVSFTPLIGTYEQFYTVLNGVGIAQIIFFRIDGQVEAYEGKYQDQGKDATPAIFE